MLSIAKKLGLKNNGPHRESAELLQFVIKRRRANSTFFNYRNCFFQKDRASSVNF